MWRVLRPDAITVWHNPEVRKRLSWYYEVMSDRKPAKFLICKRMPCEISLNDSDLDELWDEHRRLSEEFDKLWELIRYKGKDLSSIGDIPKVSFLDLKIEIAKRLLRSCCFCEHRCGVDRLKGQRGFCRLDYRTVVHSWFHHYGEEGPLVPSGTIFYGGCNFRCVFCQNYDISQENIYGGIEVNPRQLAIIQKELRKEGARNINHVGGEPTPNLHTILESLRYLEVNVPQLWNSNMYCSEETMSLLREIIDIWLPDFKYGNDKCALRLSGIKRYVEVVTRNLRIAYECGDMIIRHLVLPNHIDCCTDPILKWISENTPGALVNIMGQYRPEYLVERYPDKWPDIARRPYSDELRKAFDLGRKYNLCFEPVS